MSAGGVKSCAVVVDGLESPHGTEMFAVLMAAALKERGWVLRFHAARYFPDKSCWAGLLNSLQIQVERPRFWFLTRHYLPHRLAVRQFWRSCRQQRPDVIWSPTTDMMTCLALQKKPRSAPPFFVHDPNDASACTYYPKLWPQVCNGVTALSVHGQRQRQGALSAYKIERPVGVVWPASMAPGRQVAPPFRDGVIRFGQFGRLYDMKGALLSISALGRCLQAGGRAELHFHGDGPQREEAQALARSLGVGQYVFFHGSYSYDKLDELMADVDVGLMPSSYEGFGLVMLELMSRGRPVISTDVGSSHEVLTGMHCGMVVPCGDEVALGAAMAEAIRQREKMQEMGVRAHEVWNSHFTTQAFATRMIEFWRNNGAAI